MDLGTRLRTIFNRTPKQSGEKALSKVERGLTDREITTAAQDRFDFQDYAEVLAKRIDQAGTPITIGVFGSWGTGKTSLMRLIQEQLGSDETVKMLWINVWQLSNQEEIWSAFLQALLTKVHGELPRFRRWIFDWTLFRERVKWGDLIRTLIENGYRIVITITPTLLAVFWPDQTVSNTNELLAFALDPLVGGSASLFLGLWLLVRPAVEAAKEKVSLDLSTVLKDVPYEIKISELQKLEQQFSRMVQAWVGKEGRLVIFIDDLDRCTPPKIPELLEALKLFTTTPGCVYVLGLDYDIVRKGIRKRYEFDDEEAEEYLEKIIQVPFHLPPLDEGKIENFVKVNHPDLVARCPTAAQVFARGVEPNPRKLKRCTNVYRTVLDLADKRVAVWEMDPVDDELVAKIVVLQSRFRKLHEYISQKPDELRSFDAAKGNILQNEDHPKRATLLGEDEDTRLVKSDEIEPMVALLDAGEKHFDDPDQEWKTSSYIYLIATAEGTATGVRPNRQERERLLGGDLEKIKPQVDEIKKREQEAAYIKRLTDVLKDHARYTPSEVASANQALDLLEGFEREDFEPVTVRVPAGPFLMGSSDSDNKALDEEKPQYEVNLSEYRIGKYPITNAEYQFFLEQSDHQAPQDWEGENFALEKGYHPVTYISWHDAVAYCAWLTAETGRNYRLPTEAEREKAARGTDGRIYPWGNEWDETKCNTAESRVGRTTPVGQYSPQGDSPYGAADIAGNVWEWAADWLGQYDLYVGGSAKDPQGPQEGERRVVRGGSWSDHLSRARCATRLGDRSDFRGGFHGFRVVVDMATVPEWQRTEIEEWQKSPASYLSVKLDDELASSVNYPDISAPFKKPIFGRDEVPFELTIDENHQLIKGIEVSTKQSEKSQQQSVIIPGAISAKTVYVLCTAGNAHLNIGDAELWGKRIGCLEFEFDDGDTHRVDLIVGKNIRDWSYKHEKVVGTLSDFRAEQVWRDPKNEATIDMLRIELTDAPRDVRQCKVIAELQDIPTSYEGLLPTIRIAGITCSNYLNDLLSGDRQKLSSQMEKIKHKGEESYYFDRLYDVIIDHTNYSPSEVESANSALDLLEGVEREDFEPVMVRIPAGPFLMGSTDAQIEKAVQAGLSEEIAVQERTQHELELPAYRIGKYSVTNAEYQVFMKETGHTPPRHWDGENYLDEKGDHPVVYVTWHDAMAYCKWLSEKTGKAYTLPSEAEWEQAARGEEGPIYPWGDEFDPERCNTKESGIGGTTPVSQYSPQGDSPCGCVDMAGNVWEWTRSIFEEYPYVPDDGREDLEASGERVLRGGSWNNNWNGARCAARRRNSSERRHGHFGFRVVVSPSGSEL
jgi:formylglycine-generating enzyme required for sulfatase activity